MICVGCNRCLAQTSCTLEDDMNDLYEKLRDADVVLLASPDYFGTVSARMKNFMDRTRPFHMVENVLTGKVGGGRAQQLRGRGNARCSGQLVRHSGNALRAPAHRGRALVRRRGGHGLRGARRDRAAPLALGEGRRDRVRPGPAAGARGRVPGRAAGIAFLHSARADKTVVKLTE